MAGAAKKRVAKEKQSSNGSSEERSSSDKTAENGQRSSPQRSSPTNPPRYDGNRDPGPAGPRDPQRAAVVSDARNLEGLGFAGWALARGVSAVLSFSSTYDSRSSVMRAASVIRYCQPACARAASRRQPLQMIVCLSRLHLHRPDAHLSNAAGRHTAARARVDQAYKQAVSSCLSLFLHLSLPVCSLFFLVRSSPRMPQLVPRLPDHSYQSASSQSLQQPWPRALPSAILMH